MIINEIRFLLAANSKSHAHHTYPKTPESNPRYAVLSVQSVTDSPTAAELDDLSA